MLNKPYLSVSVFTEGYNIFGNTTKEMLVLREGKPLRKGKTLKICKNQQSGAIEVFLSFITCVSNKINGIS